MQSFDPGYGRCPCSGVYNPRTVECNFKSSGPMIKLRDISQGACPSCGSRVYKAVVLGQLEAAFILANTSLRIQ